MVAGRHPIEDPALLRTVLREETIDAEYAEPGHPALASTPEIWERICQEAVGRAGSANPVHALEHAECEALLGLRISERLIGGHWLPGGGSLCPVHFTHGLAAAAVRRGATLATQKVRSRRTAVRVAPIHIFSCSTLVTLTYYARLWCNEVSSSQGKSRSQWHWRHRPLH